MIISRTPLRVSFVGGGSDLAEIYREFGGAVVSTAIDKYVYVTVNRKFDDGIRVAYSKTEHVESVDEIEHQLVRAVLTMLDVKGGIEITTVADIPSHGTGLGSSSAFTIALLQAVHAFIGRHTSSSRLAEESCRVEIDICGEPIGKQDQYASAFGGFNLIEFNRDDTVQVSPIICKPDIFAQLRQNMLLLYTGITRSASGVLRSQADAVRASPDKKQSLRKMVQLAYRLRDELQDNNIEAFGHILHENWELKRSLAEQISTTEIDEWYATGRKHGAIGGKILGAGAGGFLLMYAPPDRHGAICHALPNLRPVDFEFERSGSQIVFYNP